MINNVNVTYGSLNVDILYIYDMCAVWIDHLAIVLL